LRERKARSEVIGGGGNGKEELAKPEVRNDKQGFTGHHASEVRIVKSNRVGDAGKLVGS